jgi:mono/diheme cytochrome c family protein
VRDPRNPGRRRLPRATAEAGLILVALLLMLAAATAGYLVGRETGDGGGAAAETTAETETGDGETTETTETAPGTTETETTETETGDGGGGDVDGSAVFAEAGCGSCHTFGPANASGTIGPNLEETALNRDEIADVVRNGRNAMPAFGGRLSDGEIEAVADFVESG